MPASRRNIQSDQLQRSRSRNAAERRYTLPEDESRRRRQIRSWIIVAVAVLLITGIITWALGSRGTREISVSRLPCYSNQSVTPFGKKILYYDGASIHCLDSGGAIQWSFPAGTGVTFSAGPTHVAIWSGAKLFLVDEKGNATYNETQEGPVQFARVGERYVAVVVGEDTAPKLLVKDLNGAQVDTEADAFSTLMMLDCGFYGNQGEYLWTLSLDVFGTAANTIMNTFQVGKMNTGEVSLGESLTYKVLYENARLRVFTTQQMYTYDYKCVQDTNATMLVYGWKVIDAEIPARGNARILLAPTSQTSSAQVITELRLLEGTSDKRYTLPAACVGACIQDGNIYAISSEYLYRADVNSQKFFTIGIPMPDKAKITAFYGTTKDGRALVASGESMYSVTLPKR